METEKIIGLFKTVTSDAVIEIAVVIALSVAIIWLSQRLFPWLAAHLHGKQRLFVLAMIPTLRVFVFILATIWIIPMVIETTVQNMVAILGAAGLAIGFAMKDY